MWHNIILKSIKQNLYIHLLHYPHLDSFMSSQNKSPVITSASAPTPKPIEQEMRVKKRDGSLQEIQFDKILTRVKKIGQQANVSINFSALVMKIIDQLYDGIPTTKIDELTASSL